MGLFGSNKDDTRAKIEELKAKMQGGQQGQQAPPQSAPQQQAWQGQPQQAPEGWQPPRQQSSQPQPPQQPKPEPTVEPAPSFDSSHKGILLDLGDGMSLNLPIREKMELAEFLRVADRVRELRKIDHH